MMALYFNPQSMRLFSLNPDEAPSVGTLLKQYAQQHPKCEISYITKMFEQRFQRCISTIDADHASYTFTQEQIEKILAVLEISYIRIY